MSRVIQREVALGLVDTWQETDADELEARLADPADDHEAARRFFELRQAIMACMRASFEQAPDPGESAGTLLLTAATFSGVLLQIAHGDQPISRASFEHVAAIFMQVFAQAAGISNVHVETSENPADQDDPTRH